MKLTHSIFMLYFLGFVRLFQFAPGGGCDFVFMAAVNNVLDSVGSGGVGGKHLSEPVCLCAGFHRFQF